MEHENLLEEFNKKESFLSSESDNGINHDDLKKISSK
jgi:hypothetical protein